MNEVQLDKNSYARRLRDECNREGLVRCYAPPHRLLNADDERVIAFASDHGRLLLTYDRAIAYDWPQALAGGFPGILILALEDNSPRQMTRSIAMQMLRQFKEEYPGWHDLECGNSVVELQPRLVFVYHIERFAVAMTGWIDRNVSGWQRELGGMLQLNVHRATQ